jgi:hypothetical protein
MRNVAMYSFVLILSGPDEMAEDRLNALYKAGCDDATFSARGGVSYAAFDREAGSFAEAVGSAIRDVEGAVPGLVVRVEREEPVLQPVGA